MNELITVVHSTGQCDRFVCQEIVRGILCGEGTTAADKENGVVFLACCKSIVKNAVGYFFDSHKNSLLLL